MASSHLHLHLHLLLLLLLLLRTISPQCHRVRGPSCSVPVAPGAHALGWGVDVSTLSPTGGRVLQVGEPPRRTPGTPCVVCADPLAGGSPRRLPPGLGGWRSGRRCHQGARTAAGARALGTLLAGLEGAARGWRLGLGGPSSGALAVAGSHSRVADFALERQRQDRVAFAHLELRCVHYWTWVAPTARPTPHFLRAVRSLPTRFTAATADAFAAILASYGTHFVRAAHLGGLLRAVTAVRACRAATMGSGTREVTDCLGAEVTAVGARARGDAVFSACRAARTLHVDNVTFHEAFSDRLVEVEGGRHHGDLLYGRDGARAAWLRTLPRSPAPVAAQVLPLHSLVAPGDPRRAALRAAIGHYLEWRALRVNCSRRCAGGHPVGPCECGCSALGGDGGDGDGGWVTSECCSWRRGAAKLTVVISRGWGWWGDHFSKPDVYVRVAFGSKRAQTATAWNTGRPRWAAILDLGTVELLPGPHLKLEVWDEDNKWDDDFLGSCEEEIRGDEGEKEVVCFPGGGRLEFRYRATCGPALGGPLCQDYVPQPPGEDGAAFSRLSRWPPAPGDGGVGWSDREEAAGDDGEDVEFGLGGFVEGEEEEDAEFGGRLEPTDAFGDLPGPLGAFGKGVVEVEPGSGFQEDP